MRFADEDKKALAWAPLVDVVPVYSPVALWKNVSLASVNRRLIQMGNFARMSQ